jgi:putative ABC transport system permease protein
VKVRWLLFRRRLEADMETEMQSHLALRCADLEREGLSAAAARRQASLEFGALDAAKEEARAARGVRWLDELGQDLRFSARMLRKNPGYAAAAVLTLALGIGACSTVFTLVQSILLRPAPIRAAGRVVVVWDTAPARGMTRDGPSGLDYLYWRAHSRSFSDLFLLEHGTGTITGEGKPVQASGLRVTPNFMDFFGIRPMLGRGFGPAEWQRQRHVMLLGYRFWRERFAGDPGVIGRGVELNGVDYTVIGVIPADINSLFHIDVVVPFDKDSAQRADGDLGVLGRLKRGVGLAAASAEMSGLMRRMALKRPERRGYGTVLVPLQDVRVEYIRPALWMLLGAVGFVLLIACANVAILMLGRASNRQREFALRRALGATQARLARQCLAESAWLALLGGAGGWLIASAAIGLLRPVLPASIPVPNGGDRVPIPPIHLGGHVLAFTAAMTLLTVLLGLAPAAASRGSGLTPALKSGRAKGGRSAGSGRNRFVAIESALAILLLVGAGQMIAGFRRMLNAGLGVRTRDIVTLRMKLANDAPDSPFKNAARQAQEFQAFLRSVRRVPGVQSAGLTEIIPLSQDDMDRYTFVVQGARGASPDAIHAASFRSISPGFIETMGIPLLAGRAFTAADGAHARKVVLIDAALKRRYFRGESAIGQHIQIGGPAATPRDIVGVVGSVKELGYAQPAMPTIYLPFLQSPVQSMGLVVRTRLATGAIVPAIERAIWAVDPNQAVFSPRTMSEIVAGMTSAQRLSILLLDSFALLALALMVTGIYSVVAYSVTLRTREIGVRMALGADAKTVMRAVLGEGVRFALRGAVAGAAAAFLVLRLLAHAVYGLEPPGAVSLAAALAVAAATALAASAVPARRAMRVDPVQALRGD